MKIVITYDPIEKSVYQHFGETQNFLVYDSENESCSIIDNGGYSHHELIQYLADLGADVVICGGIGSHAIDVFSASGIEVIPGVSGLAEDALKTFLDKKLQGNNSAIHECSHSH